MRDAVLVLGMHRSGTSAVAGTLMKLGGGAPKTLMPATAYNERGHFESMSLYHFHDELLASAGSTWDDWRAFNPGWLVSPAAASFKRRADEILQAEFDSAPLPVVKDPRISRFAPFWLDVLRESEHVPHVVIPIRSPLDVALSLKKRDGFPVTKGLLLWLRHCLDAEAQTRSEARSVFLWRDFASGWRGVCERIATDTRLSWPRLSDRSALEIDGFISQSLIHHQTDLENLRANPDVHEWAVRAYEALIELSRNPLSNSALATLDQIRTLLDESGAIFGRLLIDYEVGIERLQDQAGQAVGERDRLQAGHDALAAERDEARNVLSARIADFERALSDTERERATLSEAAQSARAERDALADERGRLASELDETRNRLADQSARAADLEQAFIRAENETDSLSEALAAARGERDALAEERDRLAAESGASRLEAAELSNRTAALERTLAEAVRARDAVAAEGHALIEERSQLLARLDERQQELSQISARSAEFERALSEAARDKEALSRARDASAGERDSLAAELGASRLEVAELSDRAAELERALADVQSGRHSLMAELASSRSDRDALAAERERLAGDLDALRRDHAARTAEYDRALRDARSESDAVRDALVAERRALADECAGLAADLAARRRDMSALSARQGELKRALGEATDSRDKLAADLERIRREKAQAEAAHGRIADDLAEAQRARDALAVERDRLAAELDGRRRLVAEHAASVEAAKRDHGAEMRALRTRLVDAEAALSHATTKRARGGLLPGLWRAMMARKLVRSGLLEPEWYAATYPDVAESGLRPAAHYLEIGYARGYKPNPFFDTRFYLEHNEDVRRSGLNPLLHYHLHGWREGRDPSPEFSTRYYLAENSDVKASGWNPLSHYLQNGRHEGRLPSSKGSLPVTPSSATHRQLMA